jgi:hypothetical protein
MPIVSNLIFSSRSALIFSATRTLRCFPSCRARVFRRHGVIFPDINILDSDTREYHAEGPDGGPNLGSAVLPISADFGLPRRSGKRRVGGRAVPIDPEIERLRSSTLKIILRQP